MCSAHLLSCCPLPAFKKYYLRHKHFPHSQPTLLHIPKPLPAKLTAVGPLPGCTGAFSAAQMAGTVRMSPSVAPRSEPLCSLPPTQLVVEAGHLFLDLSPS